jgi:hypothetical protein
MIIRQGDVKLIRVNELPKDAVKLKGKVLQESETSGHHHHFKPDAGVVLYQTKSEPNSDLTITPDFGKFIVVEYESDLFHGKGFIDNPATDGSGDHKALRINPGTYKVVIKREYDYASKSHKQVVD